jgi:hypothetical protein
MNRLIATVLCDVRLQIRNGFYYAAAFVAMFWTLVLSRIPPDRLTLWMPVDADPQKGSDLPFKVAMSNLIPADRAR